MYKFTTGAAAAIAISGAAYAENVEIYVTDMLDNIQSGYCLDIAKAQGANANPDDGLQAHTCYSPSGEIYVDQAFDSEQFADGVIYMPEFDVCMQASSTEAGAEVELVECDGSEAQSWAFDGEGTIAPAAATDVCLTLAEETRTGRSDENQMKALTLETCSEDAAATQTWANRTAE
ncbi:RICIN domain-containing protein [Octadecabacter sp. CECT 8868]|uniref:ricin-type beta-trefoil lectin domain protein n=1 Tax=Octadecabacter algicola TaxID=2909342 RepID=UPI001F466B95|nr:ricin-type beta-trefoil lectin domain protein [Octadecabacter algicola]MCF2905156.1 RICIN domain-containing protein [Octadecabacter algicola]